MSITVIRQSIERDLVFHEFLLFGFLVFYHFSFFQGTLNEAGVEGGRTIFKTDGGDDDNAMMVVMMIIIAEDESVLVNKSQGYIIAWCSMTCQFNTPFIHYKHDMCI